MNPLPMSTKRTIYQRKQKARLKKDPNWSRRKPQRKIHPSSRCPSRRHLVKHSRLGKRLLLLPRRVRWEGARREISRIFLRRSDVAFFLALIHLMEHVWVCQVRRVWSGRVIRLIKDVAHLEYGGFMSRHQDIARERMWRTEVQKPHLIFARKAARHPCSHFIRINTPCRPS